MNEPGLVQPPVQTVKVFYEAARDTAYHVAEDVELNPLRSVLTSGFLYLADEVAPTEKLEIHLNPNTIVANGYEVLPFYVRALDRLGNPVIGERLEVRIREGQAELRQLEERTDMNGLVTVVLTAPAIPGPIRIEATSERVAAQAVANAIPADARATMSIDSSGPMIGEGESVLITARILNHALQYEPGSAVAFETTDGVLTGTQSAGAGTRQYSAITDPNGEAKTLLHIPLGAAPAPGALILIKAQALTRDGEVVVEYINLSRKGT